MADRVVRTIPATVNRFTSSPINSISKRKVAGYARVSTDLEEQISSYEAQVDYYTEYIKSRDDWEFVKVYTDEGITGTSTKHREGFKQMVADAMAGKIDLIITKSVSRFARNTVDSLTTIRKLKDNGTECYFEKENIWTFDSKGELLLTIMSSIAQEEARSISENCTWSQRKRFEKGHVAVPFKRFLGYDRGEDGNLVVNEEQAKIVRHIFGLYIKGYSPHDIAKILMSDNVPSPTGKNKWYPSAVKSMLTNEKYKGDALLQKTYTADFLTKEKRKNNGEIQQYYVKNNHEPIIDRETFDMVQKLIKNGTEHRIGKNVFSGKIICGECGNVYGPKVWHSTSKSRRIVWRCNKKYEHGCTITHIEEQMIKDKFVEAINSIDKTHVISDLEEIKKELFDESRIIKEIDKVSASIDNIIHRNANLPLNQRAYQEEYNKLAMEYNKLTTQLNDLQNKKSRIEDMELFLKNLTTITKFDENLFRNTVDHVTVYGTDNITFTFKNGETI